MNIKSLLSELGIQHKSKMHKQWLMCHCISGLHEDKNPDMGVNLSTGIFNCFACGFSTNIYKVVQQRKNISYKEAVKYVDGDVDTTDYISKDPIANIQKEVHSHGSRHNDACNSNNSYPFISYKLNNPESFEYTKFRGYTENYCKEFGIKVALSSFYNDYMITPIIDSELGLQYFEARKLMHHEYLTKYFNGNKEEFEFIIRGKKNCGIEFNTIEKYLLQNKVLYPSGSMVNRTIYNRDNLLLDSPLIITEGTASHPKIYQHISKNVTSVFGINITDEQIIILKQFKKEKIILSDNDRASYEMIEYLNKFFKDIYVYDCYADDKDDDFVDKLKSCDIIKAEKFLVKRRFL